MSQPAPTRNDEPGAGTADGARRFAGRGPDRRVPGGSGRFGAARSFPFTVGDRIDPAGVAGYYIGFQAKAPEPDWPPPWLARVGRPLFQTVAQWALGAWERWLAGEGERWREAALGACAYLLEHQETGGPRRGGWVHHFDHTSTFRVAAPWVSGMAQGEAASILVRAYGETGEERYAEAARLAMAPLTRTPKQGGVRATVSMEPGGEGFVCEEYPTDPPSLVLNGAVFALWGCRDVAVGLGDATARQLFDEGTASLAATIDRYDTGWWSRYDLFPHPIVNVASPAYHRLHIDQLRATAMLVPSPSFERAAERWARYDRSRAKLARVYAHKAVFRVLEPRSSRVARLLPWARRSRG